MQRASLIIRACSLSLRLTLTAPGVLSEVFAQVSGTPGEEEVEVLRNRVQPLELQNARILVQLSQIQSLLGLTVSTEASRTRDEQVASTGPAPASSVSRVLGASSLLTRLSPRVRRQSEAPIVRTEGNDSEIGFYGFVRIDTIFDDSRASAFQTPTFIRSEPSNTDSQSNFNVHPRLSRIGMKFRAPNALESLGDARLTERIEADFQNGGRESRAVPRMRHAYLRLD